MIAPAKVQIRLTDIDILGHVNNSIYLVYFEMARIHYFNHMVGPNWDWLEQGVVLVKNEVEYIQPLYLHDQPEIKLFLKHIGNKSFTLAYQLFVKDKLCTTGSSTLVGFNSKTQQTIEIPERMKAALSQLEQI
jgi:acyl-CoA thioester hydrolase